MTVVIFQQFLKLPESILDYDKVNKTGLLINNNENDLYFSVTANTDDLAKSVYISARLKRR